MDRNKLLAIAKPILFNTDMVQAILEGRKTTTRRVVKGLDGLDVYSAEPTEHSLESGDLNEWEFAYGFHDSHAFYDAYKEVKCPYKVGDYLYVRETWKMVRYKVPRHAIPANFREYGYIYKADGIANSDGTPIKWHPSIHMPKEAARIFLRVTDVRIKRLHDMWASDVSKEGIYFTKPHTADEMITKFAKLWNSTISKKGLDKYGWDANPWVWVIQFERVEV